MDAPASAGGRRGGSRKNQMLQRVRSVQQAPTRWAGQAPLKSQKRPSQRMDVVSAKPATMGQPSRPTMGAGGVDGGGLGFIFGEGGDVHGGGEGEAGDEAGEDDGAGEQEAGGAGIVGEGAERPTGGDESLIWRHEMGKGACR